MPNNRPRLIFLVSLPRSGSTLLQAIMGTHSQILTHSEPWIALGPISLWRERAGEFDFNLELAQRAQRAFFSEAEISEDEVRGATRAFLTTLYAKALQGSGKSIFLDKTPRYYEILFELYATFPDAHFVLLHRNPLDILVSMLKTWVQDSPQKLFFYQRDLQVAIPKINEFQNKGFSNVTSIKYEDIIEDPKKQVAELCEFIGVEFEPEMLHYDSHPDWKFGDQKFKEQLSVDQTRQEHDPAQLAVAHQQFLKCYVSDLSQEDCESFGYDYRSLEKRISGLKGDTSAEELWNLIMSLEMYRDFRTTRLLLDQRLQELREKRKGSHRLLFWKK